MATMILSTAGAAVGGAVGGPLGAMAGAYIGSQVGGVIDDAVFGVPTSHHNGARLADLSVQVSTYGKMIPIVHGTVRIAGNVIWSRPIKESATTSTSSSGGGKGGGGSRSSTTTYSYSVTLAIALCEGEIDELLRVWADAGVVDFTTATYRIYKGTETQLPDSLIESFEGIGNVPAYRNMAYVVIEDFPLADYGNRIPNFTFEVKKSTKIEDYNNQSAEEMITGVTMIPGAGEFVYDTDIQEHLAGEIINGEWAQAGYIEPVNAHNAQGTANALLSVEQLDKTCPNLEWVSVVVNWFGDSLDAGACTILPAVEYKIGGTTQPDTWSVAGYNRSTAPQIALDGGSPRYGGTPDDDSLLRYIAALKARGYKVMLLPMFFMDLPDKPWRGRVTGSNSDVASFFTKTNGYNQFINHYANLCAGKVDAFAIGSELVSLTKVTNGSGVYPAVDALISLAASVRTAMGATTILTYAADWSEYHHTDGGWYHLDQLWASPNIDVVGIDAYFPLADTPQRILGYDIDAIKAGWDSGEGYDWYYSDSARTVQTSLDPKYAWKNLDWWWNNSHINPDSTATAWIPQSKKIWFTEYGYPSVDGAINQPNIFYDESSSESGFPHHSQGYVDFRAQRAAIVATESRWKNSSMVEQMFLWTWDARPYPYFPDMLKVWADGGVWATGHWVSGKFGMSSLAAIVTELCERVGLDSSRLDVSRLNSLVEGYIITNQQSVRSLLESLMGAYFFDGVESGTQLKFIPRGASLAANIPAESLLRDSDSGTLLTTRTQELKLPERVEITSLNRAKDYQPSTQIIRRHNADSQDIQTLNLPLVLGEAEARNMADIALYQSWLSRLSYRFILSEDYAALESSDVVQITDEKGKDHIVRITRQLKDRGRIRIDAVAENPDLYQLNRSDSDSFGNNGSETDFTSSQIAATALRVLDIPALPADNSEDIPLRYAIAGVGRNWQGSAIYRSGDGGANYSQIISGDQAAFIGTVAIPPADFTAGNIFDETSELEVILLGDAELESTTTLAVLNGANAALIGSEIIQFRNATEIGEGRYRLSGLLRGRLGTEWARTGHIAGEQFTLLDERLLKEQAADAIIGTEKHYKAISLGDTLGSANSQVITYNAIALKPYSPVHLLGKRDISGNLTINWTRRTRIGGNWRDSVDVPLSEATEKYEIEIMNGATIIRTETISSPSYIYSSSDQIADFGSTQSNVTVRVYQLSEKVGRGYVAENIL